MVDTPVDEEEVSAVSGAVSSDLTVAAVALVNIPGIALVPPDGSESSYEVDRSGGILGQGTRTGCIKPGFFRS